jgi:hypothetical protein
MPPILQAAGDSYNAQKRSLGREVIAHIQDVVLGDLYDIVFFEEIYQIVNKGIIPSGILIDLIKKKPAHVELVLTGRDADLVVMIPPRLSVSDFMGRLKGHSSIRLSKRFKDLQKKAPLGRSLLGKRLLCRHHRP